MTSPPNSPSSVQGIGSSLSNVIFDVLKLITPFKALTKPYSIRYNTDKGKGADTVAFAFFRFYVKEIKL